MLDLITTPPFRALPASTRNKLLESIREFRTAPGELVESPVAEDGVWLVAEGRLELRDGGRVIRRLGTGHLLGLRHVLLGEPIGARAYAVGPVRGQFLPGSVLLAAVREHRQLAMDFARIFRDRQQVFAAFDAFVAALGKGVSDGKIDVEALISLYRALQPALHPGVDRPELDLGALAYAARRLPENISRTFVLFLTDDVPPVHEHPDEKFLTIPTASRPRSTWEMTPGKSMVLLRDGMSDLIDLASCLCVWAVEAQKIRTRMEEGAGFSLEETARLRGIFGEGLDERLAEIGVHHEDFHLPIHRQQERVQRRHAERWADQIADATRELLGVEPADLPDGTRVHVISSNTHSVPNCASPWVAERLGEIVAWGRATAHPLAAERWVYDEDLGYALLRDWCAAHPVEAAGREASDREAGHLNLTRLAFTGIHVGLFDLGRLRGRTVDPHVGRLGCGQGPELVVNIDFAFGQQATEIADTLISLFGRHLSSFHVLGKAGALQGQRGDVLVATGFVDEDRDVYTPLDGAEGKDLEELLAGRPLHRGTLLTVPGTLLQNGPMLHYYRNLWGCVGLEMEGTFYARSLAEAEALGLVPSGLDKTFWYYVSDLPLDHGANLSGRLAPSEGIPPLYAITRAVLRRIS